jgi:hypothetical protein
MSATSSLYARYVLQHISTTAIVVPYLCDAARGLHYCRQCMSSHSEIKHQHAYRTDALSQALQFVVDKGIQAHAV